MLNEVHAHFIEAVRSGRGDRLLETEGIFSGLIWSGETALSLGLVDAYGNTQSVARELEAEQIVDFTVQPGLLERLAGRLGASIGQGVSQSLLGGTGLN